MLWTAAAAEQEAVLLREVVLAAGGGGKCRGRHNTTKAAWCHHEDKALTKDVHHRH